MNITYDKFKSLIEKNDFIPDIDDTKYLKRYLEQEGIEVNISLIDLGKLYNTFSEETWAASWEDNAEAQFIEWLKNKMGATKPFDDGKSICYLN